MGCLRLPVSEGRSSRRGMAGESPDAWSCHPTLPTPSQAAEPLERSVARSWLLGSEFSSFRVVPCHPWT